jgi:hypothetical protein
MKKLSVFVVTLAALGSLSADARPPAATSSTPSSGLASGLASVYPAAFIEVDLATAGSAGGEHVVLNPQILTPFDREAVITLADSQLGPVRLAVTPRRVGGGKVCLQVAARLGPAAGEHTTWTYDSTLVLGNGERGVLPPPSTPTVVAVGVSPPAISVTPNILYSEADLQLLFERRMAERAAALERLREKLSAP